MCVGLMSDPNLGSSISAASPAAASSVTGSLDAVREALGGDEGVKTMMRWFQGTVAATTLWSGLSYAFLKDAVTILGPDEALKKKQGLRGRMIIGSSFGLVIFAAAVFAWRDWLRGIEEEERKD